MQYLSEQLLLYYSFVSLPPSLVATSIVWLVCNHFDRPAMEMLDLTKHHPSELRSVVAMILDVHRSASTHILQFVRRKYLQESFNKVAGEELFHFLFVLIFASHLLVFPHVSLHTSLRPCIPAAIELDKESVLDQLGKHCGIDFEIENAAGP